MLLLHLERRPEVINFNVHYEVLFVLSCIEVIPKYVKISFKQGIINEGGCSLLLLSKFLAKKQTCVWQVGQQKHYQEVVPGQLFLLHLKSDSLGLSCWNAFLTQGVCSHFFSLGQKFSCYMLDVLKYSTLKVEFQPNPGQQTRESQADGLHSQVTHSDCTYTPLIHVKRGK